MPTSVQKIVVCMILIAIAAVAFWPAFRSPGVPMDEGMVLVYPELLLKGYLPYRDFESITPPTNPLILAVAYATFGTSIFVERAVGLTYRLLIVLAVFGIAQRWGILISSGCAFAVAVLLGSTDLWANTWYPGIAFALCSFWAAANVASRWRCILSGLLAGLAATTRFDLGPALAISLLPLFISMDRRDKLFFLAAGVVGLLPLIWITIAVGAPLIFYSLFVFPVFHLNAGRHLPIQQASSELIHLLVFQIVASLVAVLAAVAQYRKRDARASGHLLLGIAIFGLALIHYAWERFDSGHAINAALVALSFLPLSIFVALAEVRKFTPRRTLAATTAILIALFALHLIVPTYARYFYRNLQVMARLAPPRHATKNGEELEPGDDGFFITHNGRSFPFGFPYAADEADKVLSELERVGVPGQRLLVGPGDLRMTNYCDTYIYYLEPQLIPATYFLEMDPAWAKGPGSRLARDVASADWLILNRRWDFLSEANASIRQGSSEPNQVLKQDFELWWEHGAYLLFRNKKLNNAVMQPAP